MPFTVRDIVYGGVAPVVTTIALLVLLRRLLPSELSARYAAPLTVLVGFWTGLALLELSPWQPATHWHWLPYALLGAGVVGPIASLRDARLVGRMLCYCLLAGVAGWFLIPTWEDLTPSRSYYIAGFVVYVVVLATCLEPLARRLPGPIVPAILWAAMTTATVILALSGSLRFAQIAMAGAAALFGLTLVAGFKRDEEISSGVAAIFAVMSVGSLLVGYVNSFSDIPWLAYLFVPSAPLCLWAGFFGPLDRFTGLKRIVTVLSLPFAILLGSVLLAVYFELNGAGEY